MTEDKVSSDVLRALSKGQIAEALLLITSALEELPEHSDSLMIVITKLEFIRSRIKR